MCLRMWSSRFSSDCEGSSLSIDSSSGVKVNGATFVTPDVEADNVIHVIDAVIDQKGRGMNFPNPKP